MTTRLLYWLTKIRESYWFVPGVMAFGAILLAIISLRVDSMMQEAGKYPFWINWFYAGEPEGARAILSTVAGSMITVAGVTFSITIVALTLASSQLGPRLLRSFMRDRRHHVILGTFVSSFLFCLVVLRSVGGPNGFVPEVSIALGVLSAMFSIGVLIYFIHHVAVSIQAPQVICVVAGELSASLAEVFPSQIGCPPGKDTPQPSAVDAFVVEVRSTQSGYLAGVERGSLIELATSIDGVIRLDVRPGDFLTTATIIGAVWPESKFDDSIAKRINQSLITSSVRTQLQDTGFAIDQLVEIAVRALSPGINDPFTARDCVDRLGEAFVTLAQSEAPSPWRCDGTGRVRVIARKFEFAELIESAFGPLRRYGRDSVLVLSQMAARLADVAAVAKDVVVREVLKAQLTRLAEAVREGITDTHGRETILATIASTQESLENSKA